MITSVNNFRSMNDIKTRDGIVKKNAFFRGGALDKISKKELDYLIEELGVKTVIDFRGSFEKEQAPNIKDERLKYIEIPIIDESAEVDANPEELMKTFLKDHSTDFMDSLYVGFIKNKHSREMYKQFLEVVAESEGNIYYHCSAGKDRTGFAGFLLLEILGASEQDIRDHYLASNIFAKANLEIERKKFEAMVDDFQFTDEQLLGITGVKESYIEVVEKTIKEDYTTVDHFIKEGLNVSEDTLKKIREKYQQ